MSEMSHTQSESMLTNQYRHSAVVNSQVGKFLTSESVQYWVFVSASFANTLREPEQSSVVALQVPTNRAIPSNYRLFYFDHRRFLG